MLTKRMAAMHRRRGVQRTIISFVAILMIYLVISKVVKNKPVLKSPFEIADLFSFKVKTFLIKLINHILVS